MLHMHAARQYHAQWRRGAAGLQQDFALGKGAAAHPQGLYGRGSLRLGQAAEQRHIGQFAAFHFLHLVCCYYNRFFSAIVVK